MGFTPLQEEKVPTAPLNEGGAGPQGFTPVGSAPKSSGFTPLQSTPQTTQEAPQAEHLIGREGNPAAVKEVLNENVAISPDIFTGSPFLALMQSIFDPTGETTGPAVNSFLMNLSGNAGDSVRGTKQIISEAGDGQYAAEEAETQAITNEALRQEPVGGIAGMATSLIAADPVNYVGLGLIDKAIRAPKTVNKLAKTAQLIAAGTATGAIAGQTAYLDEEVGLTRPELTAITTAAGGILTPAVVGGARLWGKSKQTRALKKLAPRVTNWENSYNLALVRSGGDRRYAAKAAKAATGLNRNQAKYVAERTGQHAMRLGKTIPEASKNLAKNPHMQSILHIDDLDILASKDIAAQKAFAATIDPSVTKSLRTAFSAGKEADSELDIILGSMMTRIRNRSPVVANALTKHDFFVSRAGNAWIEAGQPFFNELDKLVAKNKLGPEAADEFTSLLFTDRDAAFEWIKQVPGHEKLLKTSKPLVNSLEQIVKEGANIEGYVGRINGFFPRRLSADKTTRRLIFSEEKGTLASKLKNAKTDAEFTKLMNQAIQNPHTARGSSSTLGFKRAIKEVRPDQVKAYASPRAAYDSYVEDAARVIGRKKFFDELGAPDPFVKLKGEELEVGNLADSLGKLKLAPKDADQIAKILNARFGPGEKGIASKIGGLKDLSHLVLLSDVKSAATQLADVYSSMHKNGLWNAINGVNKALHKGHMTKEGVLGLKNAVADMAGTTKLKKATDWALSPFFKPLDNFGKTVFMESSAKKWSGMANTAAKGKDKAAEAFDARWAGLFDTPGSLDALKKDLIEFHNFKGPAADRPITENMGLMLWDDLSKVQPISISEMPERWARMQGGRLFYTMQSFTLKQLDLMRNDIYQAMRVGDYGRAAKNLITYSAYFTGTQAGVDYMKDHFTAGITGREPEPAPQIIMDAAIKAVGFNRYDTDRFFKSGDLGSLLFSSMSGALAPVQIPFQALARGEPERLLEYVPFVGRELKDIQSEKRKRKKAQALFGINDSVFKDLGINDVAE